MTKRIETTIHFEELGILSAVIVYGVMQISYSHYARFAIATNTEVPHTSNPIRQGRN